MSLPDDIIRELFVHASLNDPPGLAEPVDNHPHQLLYHLGWIYLTHVCQRLRTVGLDTASLWASIITVFPKPIIANVLLSRAKGCELDLGIYDRHARHQRENSDRHQQWSLWTYRLLDRARTLYFRSPHFINRPDGELSKTLTGRPLPSLLHIMFEHNLQYTESNIEILRGFALDAPRLATARLYNVILLPLSPLNDLRELEMCFNRRLKQFDLAEVLQLLTCTPRLERLSLHEEWNRLLASQGAPWAVQLDHLRFIDVRLKSTPKTAKFLESIHTPNLSAALINVIDARKVDPLPAVLFRPLESIRRYLPATEVSIGPYDLIVASTDQEDTHDLCLFHDTRLKRYVAFGLYLCEMDATMHAQCLDRVLMHMGPGLGYIRRLKVGEPTTRGSPSSDASLSGAIRELGNALTATTTLDIDLGAKGLIILRSLALGTALDFPTLDTLAVTIGIGDSTKSFITSAEAPQVVKHVLTLRAKLGIPLRTLEICGTNRECNCKLHSKTDGWTTVAEECLTQDLVKDLVDRRMTRECAPCAFFRDSN